MSLASAITAAVNAIKAAFPNSDPASSAQQTTFYTKVFDSAYKQDPMRTAAGTNLGDADTSITVTDGDWRKVPQSTLSANRTYTVSTSGAVAGDQIVITKLDFSLFQILVMNGGGGGGALMTLPGGKQAYMKIQFDGTNWALKEFGAV